MADCAVEGDAVGDGVVGDDETSGDELEQAVSANRPEAANTDRFFQYLMLVSPFALLSSKIAD